MKTKGDFDDEDSDMEKESSSESDFVDIKRKPKQPKKEQLKPQEGAVEEKVHTSDPESRNKPKKRGRPPKNPKTETKSEQKKEDESSSSMPLLLQEPSGPLWQRTSKSSAFSNVVRANETAALSEPISSGGQSSQKTMQQNVSNENGPKNEESEKVVKTSKKKQQEIESPVYVLFTYADRQFPESNSEVRVGLGEAYVKGHHNNGHLTLKSLMKPEDGAANIATCRYWKRNDVEEAYLDNDSIILKNFPVEKESAVNGVQYFRLPMHISEALQKSEAYKLLCR